MSDNQLPTHENPAPVLDLKDDTQWETLSSRLWRYVRLLVICLAGIGAAIFVAVVTVDLGPTVRERAERALSTRIERPVHIGKLSVHFMSGKFLVEDMVIEGLTPQDHPFLVCERIFVSMRWGALLGGEFLLDSVDMSNFEMLVETFSDGGNNFPKFRPDSSGTRADPEDRWFVTTLQYVRAHKGQLTYEDHGAPWSVVAPNLEVILTKILDYRGEASFSAGTVRIGSFEPMAAELRTNFQLDGSNLHLNRIDLHTDGAESVLTGDVDMGSWPEMFYEINSRVEFPVMREIFFAEDNFSAYGDGDFKGTFRAFEGGRELEGTFASDLAGVDDYRFQNLRGSLIWHSDRFEVLEATTDLYGGESEFAFSMAPLRSTVPAQANFDVNYRNVDLTTFSDFLGIPGVRPIGRATGHNVLEWPIGQYSKHRGKGKLQIVPPTGVQVLDGHIPEVVKRQPERRQSSREPYSSPLALTYVPIKAELVYSFGPEWVELAPSRVATDSSYVEFEGRTAYGDQMRIPFHVTSADWQESNRMLAGVLTALGTPTRVVSVDGYGQFDGVMLGSFKEPRVEGRFSGEQMRSWGVFWGDASGEIVIEDGYVDVAGGLIVDYPSEIHVDGRFALGFPRQDGGEELDGRIRLKSRPAVDFRHAFRLEGYSVDGPLSGELHIFGHYGRVYGFGRLEIDGATAYGETFDSASAGLRFEGNGVRVDGLEILKGNGTITGAAYVDWDGTYSFNADGRNIAVETMETVRYPRTQLSGELRFTASGVGAFDLPRYELRGRVADLFISNEDVGEMSGRVDVRDGSMALELEVASQRLAVSGFGRVALTPEADADLTFRFTNTSLDPYIRAFESRLSTFTAVVSGTIRVHGQLRNLDHLKMDGLVEQFDVNLFDYQVRNEGPIQLSLEKQVVRVERLHLTGDGTELTLAGTIGMDDEQVALSAIGDANLGILQGFFGDLRSSGNVELVAEINGSFRSPQVIGQAFIYDGRIRHFSLPHSLEAINGQLVFESGSLRFDGLTAKLGGGDVRFDGRVGMNGYTPGDLNVTAEGKAMQLRYPEGFRSVIDGTLTLQGDFYSPLLTGTVEVVDAIWVEELETATGLFDFTQGTENLIEEPTEATLPLRFDVRLVAPSTVRIDDNTARLVASAELVLRGTYDDPLLFGNAQIERGQVFFEGNRYRVTRGTIGFANPTKIEPFFDIEAETDVLVPGQIYRVVFRATGTMERLVAQLSSDPPLPEIDILQLLLGDVRDPQQGELRALRTPQMAEQQMMQVGAARLLTNPISSGVGRVVQESFGVDTFQITPSLSDLSAQQSARLNPTARLLIGKRISDRAHLTLSRALTGSDRGLVVIVEYNQSDRHSWVLSQNEDQTYALDFRLRHTF